MGIPARFAKAWGTTTQLTMKQFLVALCLLPAILADAVAEPGYGHAGHKGYHAAYAPKCHTTYETVTREACTTTYESVCNTETTTNFVTRNEQECSTRSVQECATTVRNVPEEQCATTTVPECQTIVNDVPEQECRTVSEQQCTSEQECTTETQTVVDTLLALLLGWPLPLLSPVLWLLLLPSLAMSLLLLLHRSSLQELARETLTPSQRLMPNSLGPLLELSFPLQLLCTPLPWWAPKLLHAMPSQRDSAGRFLCRCPGPFLSPSV